MFRSRSVAPIVFAVAAGAGAQSPRAGPTRTSRIDLRPVFGDVLPAILTGLPITASAIARERKEMTWHRLGRTRSRHVLGSMNDFAFLAEQYIRDDGPDLDLARIEGMLNRAPCRPIQYQSPDRLTPALFARAATV